MGGPRADLDTVAKRESRFPAPAGNRTPVIEPIAQSLLMKGKQTEKEKEECERKAEIKGSFLIVNQTTIYTSGSKFYQVTPI
jgi:hypothetical protein